MNHFELEKVFKLEKNKNNNNNKKSKKNNKKAQNMPNND
jgi:hypothetical protein